MGSSEIEVYSEIGTLKKVMLHRPGRELENLMPEYIERHKIFKFSSRSVKHNLFKCAYLGVNFNF